MVLLRWFKKGGTHAVDAGGANGRDKNGLVVIPNWDPAPFVLAALSEWSTSASRPLAAPFAGVTLGVVLRLFRDRRLWLWEAQTCGCSGFQRVVFDYYPPPTALV